MTRGNLSVNRNKISPNVNWISHFNTFSPMTIFTPGKCVSANESFAENITPVIKREVSPLPIDEDSGLGMEDDPKYQTDKDARNDVTPSSRFVDTPTDIYSFAKLKRPLDMIFKDSSNSVHKRQKKVPKRRNNKPLSKALSFGDEPVSIDKAIEHVLGRVGDESDLVSDGSRTYRLPTVRGKHQDLKCISPQTTADVLTGKYNDVISSYKIVDCRYPYEFEGGHIQQAENMYTRENISELLTNSVLEKKPDILIFHCEFSSERGPKMSRFLRNKDRELNSDNYPALHYPEIYLLSGGYKDFFYMFKNLCEPQEYKPMLHNDHNDDLRHFRSKSKSWTGDEQRRTRKSNRLLF
ncbi:hypothetical protein KUTeg_004792 [Tegillarca granosa]|uniref:M-phase inducer phosphatase n=1 Tax=Tegillarca granosa TaxID=220873 RepID=A0ABQ9FMF3_TEGGR|nr:hypothetical protein KUTeg_004792 [Tegillarca granosa]